MLTGTNGKVLLCEDRNAGAHFGVGGSLCLEEIGARASIHTCAVFCTRDCSQLFGNECVIQDLCIQNTEFLAAETCQMSHLGQKRIKQSYGSKR